ncbi:MAG: DUF554 family protein, partial [Selenomonadales bacterium]|nr:DUF554 family protein [Selenomonadales bacterium]
NSRCPHLPDGFKGGVSRSCHSLEEVVRYKDQCDYVFLSPIFDSISKEGYGSTFPEETLQEAYKQGIIDSKVIALGGIKPEHAPYLKANGFGGMAYLGYVWEKLQTPPVVLSIAGSDSSGGAGILTMAIKTQNVLVVTISMIVGAVIGEMLDIDGRLNRAGERLSARFQSSGGSIGKAFVTTSLVYCIGAMTIIGSLQDGLTGDASTLYAKAMLDGTGAVIFTATLGIGVILSVIPVFLYQGGITLLAAWIAPYLTDAVICEVTAVGGLLILGIGLMLLNISKIKIANLLPAVLVAGILCSWGIL